MKTVFITGSTVYSYFLNKCGYKLWLEWFGDPAEKVELAENEDIKLLMDYGNEHEGKIIDGIRAQAPCAVPSYVESDYDEGGQATLELMKQSVPYIYQGVLCQEGGIAEMIEEKKRQFPGLKIISFYRGIPDILEKREGRSRLGDYHYIVGDIKSSRKPI